jgi:hypothetical protein
VPCSQNLRHRFFKGFNPFSDGHCSLQFPQGQVCNYFGVHNTNGVSKALQKQAKLRHIGGMRVLQFADGWAMPEVSTFAELSSASSQ